MRTDGDGYLEIRGKTETNPPQYPNYVNLVKMKMSMTDSVSIRGTLYVQDSAMLSFMQDSHVNFTAAAVVSGNGFVYNHGNIYVGQVADTTISTKFNTYGTIGVGRHRFYVTAQTTCTGAVASTTGSHVEFRGGSHVLEEGCHLVGGGNLALSDASVTVSSERVELTNITVSGREGRLHVSRHVKLAPVYYLRVQSYGRANLYMSNSTTAYDRSVAEFNHVFISSHAALYSTGSMRIGM